MKKWYAVQVNGYDAWDNGSENFDEALKKCLKEMAEENVSTGTIVKVDEETNFAEAEYTVYENGEWE